ncbi:hypothetical protein [Limosilactobacillus fermentum]|uniref:hypothetical protein n=1 Tax=Limosilactobacillus fermentum TaxID=1613 RepID=UPI00209BE3B0|nr:hypothetical protein [Limosilactobacillus fermentum]MCO8300909.1 hypothetical protein [Limosilactobacillus fermentum]
MINENNQVPSSSPDITEQNIEKLKELFPEVLTEKKIDFDKLRLILGDEVETAPERYSFTWNGKKQSKKTEEMSDFFFRPILQLNELSDAIPKNSIDMGLE